LLFNLVADMLSLLISRPKEDEQITRLVQHLIDGGISILQYADDMILYMEHNLEQAKKYVVTIIYLWKIIMAQDQFP
jgi:hypothetical protein